MEEGLNHQRERLEQRQQRTSLSTSINTASPDGPLETGEPRSVQEKDQTKASVSEERTTPYTTRRAELYN